MLDEVRKRAYRYLLYQATLEIKWLAWYAPSWREWLVQSRWSDTIRRINYSGWLAYTFHNLALYSALDFRDFNEDQFWAYLSGLDDRYPDFAPFREYRRVFDLELRRQQDEVARPGAVAIDPSRHMADDHATGKMDGSAEIGKAQGGSVAPRGLRRISAQRNLSLRQTYEEFASDQSASSWLRDSAKQMLEVIKLLELEVAHLDMYAMTSHAELKLLAEDSIAGIARVTIQADVDSCIIVRYTAPEGAGPWPDATIEGTARGAELGVAKIMIAIRACGVPQWAIDSDDRS